jgi:hypothetical protein
MDDNLAMLDTDNGRVLATMPLGKNPRGFGAMVQE